MKYILRYLKPHTSRMLIGLAIKVFGTFADLGLPWVLAYILDDVLPLGQHNPVYFWGAIMIALSVVARVCNIRANRMASKVAAATTQQIRHDLFQKAGILSGAQVDYFTMPSLISRLTTDTYHVHQTIGMVQRMGVRAPIILLGGIVIMSTMEPVLTLAIVAILPFLALVVMGISKKTIPLYTKVQNHVDHMVNCLRENIMGIRVIKALSKGQYEEQRFRQVNDALVENELKAAGTMAASGPAMNLLLNLGLTLVIIIGAYRVNSGASDMGNILAFLSYFTMMQNSILMVNRIFLNVTKASASCARLEEVLTTENDLPIGTQEQYPGVSQSKDKSFAHIEFDHVSFRYHKESEGCLKDICFSLKAGDTLGIIGPTGCGKTTLINLLMRFYDVDEGRILINGRDVRTIPLQELRRKFGTSFQNDIVFADSVYENISFGREIPMERVAEAATDACANGFISEWKENGQEEYSCYQHQIQIKGANLSGGQKQRLFIARAFAANPEITILDDSSSALDYRTDASLRKAIRLKYPNSTIISICQRISSVMNLDHIMVMEEGRILGFGNHDELLKNCSVYREIFYTQFDRKEGEDGTTTKTI